MAKLSTSTILITAGTSRLGLELIRYFLEKEWNVITTTRSEENVVKLDKLFGNKNFVVKVLKFKEDEINKNFREMNKFFGEINTLINCASGRPKGKNIEKINIQDMLEVYDSTVNSAFLCTKEIMLQRNLNKVNSIINIGSIYGSNAVDHRIYNNPNEQTPISYSVAKAGLVMMTKYMAAYWGNTDVRINCVSPGGIEGNQSNEFIKKYSNKVPMKRLVKNNEVVETIGFLASDGSSGITGQNILVDAGMSIW